MLAGLPMICVPRALSPLPDVPKPPIAKAVSLSPPDKRTQDYVHREIMVELCIRADGFILSTGRVSYFCDRPSKKRLRTSLAEIGARKVFFTDAGAKRYYKRFFRKLKLPYQTFLMDNRSVQLGNTCPSCHRAYHCVHWMVVQRGISVFHRMKMDGIPHRMTSGCWTNERLASASGRV
ncbi:hypothetical protein AVEN_101337-1 [Araneus ventricosus]|uniref:Uncharacterized protein n=1 Tax=Araneus ventricosus TaxID=182803 RepID=A0A4Y2T9S8_ARAVE|nr:hypothetical protein AVEN_101337-1 [Araneus ventricosus]